MLLSSLDAAQQTILRHEAGLTTVCLAFVCPLQSFEFHAVCVVSVGDSLAYVLSRHHGLREITTGSRDVSCERDIRDAGGALGPVRNGCDPELHNLTLSMTFVDDDDIVFLTSDGISDNFDPVITKIAAPVATPAANGVNGAEAGGDYTDDGRQRSGTDVGQRSGDIGQRSGDVGQRSGDVGQMPGDVGQRSTDVGQRSGSDLGQRLVDVGQRSGDVGQRSEDGRPLLTPAERHQYAVKEMERIVHEFELFAESSCSAQELTGVVVQHVLKLTDVKRKVHISLSLSVSLSVCLSVCPPGVIIQHILKLTDIKRKVGLSLSVCNNQST